VPGGIIADEGGKALKQWIFLEGEAGTFISFEKNNNFFPGTQSFTVMAYGSPIFKVVQQKRCKALYTDLTESLKSLEYAAGEGSERSNGDRSVAVPQ
jgi:hypothetical protein